MTRQPWYKEGRRPQRIETCSECGRNFRDKRTAEQALLEAIFGELLCTECKQKKDFVTCSTCNEPIEKGRAIHYEDLPYHYYCLPGS